ncbi:FMN-dependent oxidoreductase (nitrilotriacetate monooxygenase family) [Allocatelliglobosispora scoriae]|uniref:FMN-dependent oxidoreductase (Nitrilotriacetate monooxygenase family) n=1 Tax=Allocatelliglobosispora scoriae TaxID=643052 RepID=A0A841BLU8_9ACTN|nr:LLM class flavin-dependent oxidoreductase [Allocatelliglobosispora scoriae]MBB5868226.1 FMN-dependent oxidoreductase (nitrilotriacetate monooxygenase family) [Allocatelliglobosispora scoriae]
MPKKIHVNLFEMNCVGHISHGLWVHPDNNRHRFNDIEFWTELAKLLEYGGFDAVFLADVIGAYDGFRGGPETALREAVQIPNNDPLLLIPAMAAVTRNLGFAATFSTTYEPPFAFARRMSTLDHLTKGRVAWNVVTSYLPNAARNFGLADEVEHDQRYAIADEYLDVLYKLWEGSWDDDAVIRDVANRVYTDPAKVRYINHVGKHYVVAGPHLSEPSRQRTPVIYQAGASDAGREFAAKHAEAVFVGGFTLDAVRANISDTKDRAERYGRQRDHIKFLAGAAVIVGKTDADVERKVEEFRRLRSVDGHLAHAGAGLDWTRYDPSERVGDIIERQDPGFQRLGRGFTPDQTVGEVLERIGGFNRGPFFVAGTPKVVADELEKWVDTGGIDGINLRQFLTPGTAEDFIELVVPELRKRGRYRESYDDGETLRERLFGAGQSRLPDVHPGARYRDPAALLV